jgi:small GTP-binding protein
MSREHLRASGGERRSGRKLEHLDLRSVGSGCGAEITVLEWDLRGNFLAIGDAAGHVKVMDFEGPPEPRRRIAKSAVTGICWLVTLDFFEKIFVSTERGELVELLLSESELIPSFRRKIDDSITNLALSPDNETIALSTKDGLLHLWSIPEQKRIDTIQAIGRSIHTTAWSPNGELLAVGGAGGKLCIYYGESGILRKQLEGHNEDVTGLSWISENSIVSTSIDATVRIWQISSGAQIILEGNSNGMVSLVYSQNVGIVAKGADGRIEFWDTNGDPLGITIADPAPLHQINRSIALTPDGARLATLDDDDSTKVRLWSLKFGNRPARGTAQAVRHATAKIVLVGDAGVGKTGLGWRLAHGSFREHPSTHGQQFWSLTDLGVIRRDGAQCEAILWDLAGQPDYRLIHALFLDDAELALVLFDPTDRRDPMHGARYWLSILTQKGKRGCPTILVGARCDRGSATVLDDQIDLFCREHGVTGGYVSTSALDGTNLDVLMERIREEIDWEQVTTIVTTRSFKLIKQLVLSLKERKQRQVVPEILLTYDELRDELRRFDAKVDIDDITLAVRHLAKYGYVNVLKPAKGTETVLLYPEMLNNLAASLILEARRNDKGLGALDESKLLHREYSFDVIRDLAPREQQILLDAAASMFISNNLCFRETLGGQTFLIFPELINLRRTSDAAEETFLEDVSYHIVGDTENLYASLVVLLGYTNVFARSEQWHSEARYQVRENISCGFKCEFGRDDELDFILYYGVNVSDSERLLFQGIFERFLAGRNVLVTRYPPFACPKCGYVQERAEIVRRTRAKKKDHFCSECGHRIELDEPGEFLVLDKPKRRIISAQQDIAAQRTQFEAALVSVKAMLRDRPADDEQRTCFVSYAWGNPGHEAWVQKTLAVDLRNAGVQVILDIWHNAQIGSSLSRFVSNIERCDRILTIGTPAYKSKYENTSRGGSIVAAEFDVISQRLMKGEKEKNTVLPLLLEGSQEEAFPPLLGGRVYADFRDEKRYFIKLLDLILSIYDFDFESRAIIDLRIP